MFTFLAVDQSAPPQFIQGGGVILRIAVYRYGYNTQGNTAPGMDAFEVPIFPTTSVAHATKTAA